MLNLHTLHPRKQRQRNPTPLVITTPSSAAKPSSKVKKARASGGDGRTVRPGPQPITPTNTDTTPDRLLSNPYAQPPLPSDYLVPSTHPVRTVPYYLAPLWDAAEFQRAVESKLHGRKNSRTIFRKKREGGYANVYGYGGMSPMEIAAVNVPKEIKGKLKWRRGGWARGLLKDLEEDVRGWVGGIWDKEKERQEVNEERADDGIARRRGKRTSAVMSDTETEDEEIVFAGRNGSTASLPLRTKSPASLRGQSQPKPLPLQSITNEEKETEQEKERQETISDSKMIFEGLEDDKSASFARWLVHCVGAYYGLRTWSVTREVDVEVEGKEGKEMAREVRREAHVGVDRRAQGFIGRGERFGRGREVELPRPLWGMV